MSDRARSAPTPRDTDGEPLIDGGALTALLRLSPAGTRKALRREDVTPIRRGAHGAWLYRLADVEGLLAERTRV